MDPGEVSDELFDQLVEEAVAQLPSGIGDFMDNVALFIEDDSPPDGPTLLGVYDGIPLTERGGTSLSFVPPDTITLFKNPLIDYAEDADHLREEILVTIVHEIAHHYGIEEGRLHELGWG